MKILKFLESLHWTCGSLLLIALFVLFAAIFLILIRRKVDRESLKENHDVAGFVFANIGVLYAVLLGFTVVNVQQRFDKIKENVHIEASYLAQLYHDAEVFSLEDRGKIQEAIKKYGAVVINEWQSVTEEGMISHRTVHALSDLWNAFYDTQLTSEKQNIWYAESIQKLNELMNARMQRLLGAEESLGPEIWTFLILGGVVMITFMSFFGLESLTLHILMTAILAASTAFLLFVIYSLDSAFCGSNPVSPEVLSNVLKSFD